MLGVACRAADRANASWGKREKIRIQKAVRQKTQGAIQGPAVQATQDWSGVAIVEGILSAFE
jgi:hypothetical protein